MADVVVIGAGAVGCATALHLKKAEPSLDVLVVEPDFTYARAATGKGTGGVRQLFTRPENIWLSQYTLDTIDDWERWGTVDDAPTPELGWRQNGYLFVVGEQDRDTLEANLESQRVNGVAAEWLDAADLAARYPELVTSDLAAGVLSTRDGWLNPKVFFSVLRAKAEAAGATFITDRVVDLTQDGSITRSVTLASGQVVSADAVINTAGVHAPELAAKVGMHIPVEPMRRHEHYIKTGADVAHLPFVKDEHGLAVHAHRQGVAVGLVDFDHPGGEDFTIDPTDYTDRVLPALTERFRLGKLTLQSSWTGLYDQNRFDGNMIIGNWPGHADNFFVACGFSGHGFMHALGVGRGLTELALYGEYRTLDLSRMGYQRILDGHRYGEEGVR
ncbi:MAG TPA: FAD-dependent oxidoreductase [Propionibacteriaceae bacterium]|nr:FAD-dependent oxidoreductase [Propionibacteriaceae bacterium]